ncbi:MAG TPA: HAMP domain-containing sensor histidine kinase [Caulobacteraceae bacterium]
MGDARATHQPTERGDRRLFWPGGLSARLLVLTALFVTLAGLLVLPPTLAAFEEQWLLDRVRAAELASLATEVSPDGKVTRRLSQQLLDGAGVVSVAVQEDGMRRLVLAAPRTLRTPYLVDLREQNPESWLAAPFNTLFGGEGRMVRVIAEPRFRSGEFVEVVTPDEPLRRELWAYLGRLFAVMVFAAVLAGSLVYLSLNAFLVKPMQRITRAMERFRADPEDPKARVTPSGRADEIGRAEAELGRMQADLVVALNSRARLAQLGEAVAKINHDLRNMLTSAQIASERLAMSGDPNVASALPRLERALDRAVTLATDVLAYGRTREPEPQLELVRFLPALETAAEDAGLSAQGVRLQPEVAATERVNADPDQLHRILTNLLRNAREAIEAAPRAHEQGRVLVTLQVHDGVSVIRLADNGPGVPEKALANLFQPFVGSGRRGGTGLGLAISRELAHGHGGDLALASTGPEGSVFELRLPGAPEPELPRRGKRATRQRAA